MAGKVVKGFISAVGTGVLGDLATKASAEIHDQLDRLEDNVVDGVEHGVHKIYDAIAMDPKHMDVKYHAPFEENVLNAKHLQLVEVGGRPERGRYGRRIRMRPILGDITHRIGNRGKFARRDVSKKFTSRLGIIPEVASYKAGFIDYFESLNKMPYSRKRYGRKRRMRRRRGKSLTKRGVKRMIKHANDVQGEYLDQYNQFGRQLLGTFGTVARAQFIPFFQLADLNAILAATQLVYPLPAATAGVGAPQAGNHTLLIKNVNWDILIHSNSNEMQEVSFWYLINQSDSNSVSYNPLTLWSAEYLQKGVNTEVIPFANNFGTYPTKYSEWNQYWKILKKCKFMLAPGKTVRWRVKGRRISFTPLDEPPHSQLENITTYFMVELKGVPTNESVGTATNVSRSITGVDITFDLKYMSGLKNSGAFKSERHFDNYQAVTAAEVINASTKQTMENQI